MPRCESQADSDSLRLYPRRPRGGEAVLENRPLLPSLVGLPCPPGQVVLAHGSSDLSRESVGDLYDSRARDCPGDGAASELVACCGMVTVKNLCHPGDVGERGSGGAGWNEYERPPRRAHDVASARSLPVDDGADEDSRQNACPRQHVGSVPHLLPIHACGDLHGRREQ